MYIYVRPKNYRILTFWFSKSIKLITHDRFSLRYLEVETRSSSNSTHNFSSLSSFQYKKEGIFIPELLADDVTGRFYDGGLITDDACLRMGEGNFFSYKGRSFAE